MLQKTEKTLPGRVPGKPYRGGWPRWREIQAEDEAARQVEIAALTADLGHTPSAAERLLIVEIAALAVRANKLRRKGQPADDVARLMVRAIGKLGLKTSSPRSGLAALRGQKRSKPKSPPAAS
jgi:hypothetical protein